MPEQGWRSERKRSTTTSHPGLRRASESKSCYDKAKTRLQVRDIDSAPPSDSACREGRLRLLAQGEAEVLTAQLRSVNSQLTSTTDSITPMQFVMALRQRFPRPWPWGRKRRIIELLHAPIFAGFAEMQNGAPMQQDMSYRVVAGRKRRDEAGKVTQT